MQLECTSYLKCKKQTNMQTKGIKNKVIVKYKQYNDA